MQALFGREERTKKEGGKGGVYGPVWATNKFAGGGKKRARKKGKDVGKTRTTRRLG